MFCYNIILVNVKLPIHNLTYVAFSEIKANIGTVSVVVPTKTELI